MKTALIRLAPVATGDAILGDATCEGRVLFDQVELRRDAPVLVDHMRDKEPVGRVLELFRMPDSGTPFAMWLVARCEIHAPPEWLRLHGPASVSYAASHRQHLNGWEIIRRSRVGEVSILSAGERPAEPCAKIVLLRDAPAPGDEVIFTAPGAILHRPGIGRVLGVR